LHWELKLWPKSMREVGFAEVEWDALGGRDEPRKTTSCATQSRARE